MADQLYDDTEEHGWTLSGLRRVIFATLQERDLRYEQRFHAQNEAIAKAEAAVERRFSGVNELRGALDDAAKLQMPRAESNARYDSLLAKLDDHSRQDMMKHQQVDSQIAALAHRIDVKEGAEVGSKDTRGDARSAWALWIAVAAVLIQAIVFAIHK